MTGRAIGRRTGKLAIDVALGARNRGVSPREWERSLRVIEDRPRPRDRRMARCARRWKPCLHVVWVGGAIELRHVARGAVGRGARKLIVDVALCACRCGMRAGERKFGKRGVIKTSSIPIHSGMANRAVVRQTGLHMAGTVGGVEVLLVTGKAIGRCSFELIVYMASNAFDRCVHACQREAGKPRMIEFGTQPGIHRMAGFASSRKVRCSVVQHRSQIIRLMAGVAGSRESPELTDGRTLVARITLHHCMRANQRESVLMVADRGDGDLPTLYAVALLAIGAELTLVYIGMAIRTA